VFGFDFSLELSTRPEKYLGDLATWDNAENVSCSISAGKLTFGSN
jgi:threonyl-tRNA synthetase